MALIKRIIKENYFLYKLYMLIIYIIPTKIFGEKRDIWETKRKYKKVFGRKIDLVHPKTMNEKIQWLKLNVREKFHIIASDKLAARDVWSKFGSDGLVPLIYYTYDWRDITLDRLPDFPFIIKCNSGSNRYQIIKNKKDINIKKLRTKCRTWFACNYYYMTQEWQYKDIKPCIMIEKLLLNKDGHIPNDYKLHFINGKLKFIYCSVDREDKNYRCIYDSNWNRIQFEWVVPKDHKGYFGADIEKPESFERMVEIGEIISRDYYYVRVDFYDVEGELYYGEITLHHGSGFDTFEPMEYDAIYGQMLEIPPN